jgi:hypothetical protein
MLKKVLNPLGIKFRSGFRRLPPPPKTKKTSVRNLPGDAIYHNNPQIGTQLMGAFGMQMPYLFISFDNFNVNKTKYSVVRPKPSNGKTTKRLQFGKVYKYGQYNQNNYNVNNTRMVRNGVLSNINISDNAAPKSMFIYRLVFLTTEEPGPSRNTVSLGKQVKYVIFFKSEKAVKEFLKKSKNMSNNKVWSFNGLNSSSYIKIPLEKTISRNLNSNNSIMKINYFNI